MKSLTDYIVESNSSNPLLDMKIVHPTNKFELQYYIKYAFSKGVHNLNFIKTDKIKDMRFLFDDIKRADSINFDVSGWDVSNVTDMSGLFVNCKYFNGDLSKWDVSNVKKTVNMFAGCYKFNGDLSNWDISNLEDMSYMFNQCFAFRGKGLENWDVSKVKDMTNAFRMCKKSAIPSWYKK